MADLTGGQRWVSMWMERLDYGVFPLEVPLTFNSQTTGQLVPCCQGNRSRLTYCSQRFLKATMSFSPSTLLSVSKPVGSVACLS